MRKSILLCFLGDPSRDRRIQSFQRLFKEAGYEVRLIAGVPSKGTYNGFEPVLLKENSGPRRFWEYDRKLKTRIKQENADVVIACDLYSLPSVAIMKRAGRARYLIYDAREVYTELPAVAHRPFVKQVWKRIEKGGLSATDRILVTAPHDLNAILSVHGFVPRSILVRNMPWREDILPRNKSSLTKFGISADQPVLVYIGGLQEGRGLRQLIRAMQHRPEQLLLIGDGPLKEELVGVGNANTHFPGSLKSHEALSVASACDVGISLIEPISKSYELALPSKIFEYMSVGLPVVSSLLIHVTELFGTAHWMTFADSFSTEAIRLAIERGTALSKDPDLRSKEKREFLTKYHFEIDARHVLDAIDSSLGR